MKRTPATCWGSLGLKPTTEAKRGEWGTCRQCGKCCSFMQFGTWDPKSLKASFEAWKNSTGRHVDDIWLLYPMLRAVKRAKSGWMFRCIHLDMDGDGKAYCAIYDNRPGVCRGFPWYGQPPPDRAGLPDGCGFEKGVDWARRKKAKLSGAHMETGDDGRRKRGKRKQNSCIGPRS